MCACVGVGVCVCVCVCVFVSVCVTLTVRPAIWRLPIGFSDRYTDRDPPEGVGLPYMLFCREKKHQRFFLKESLLNLGLGNCRVKVYSVISYKNTYVFVVVTLLSKTDIRLPKLCCWRSTLDPAQYEV